MNEMKSDEKYKSKFIKSYASLAVEFMDQFFFFWYAFVLGTVLILRTKLDEFSVSSKKNIYEASSKT